MDDFQNDAWLSGFIDGEGCFTHSGDKPSFQIGLREDDADILYQLQEEFGGHIGIHRWSTTAKHYSPNRRPQVKWRVTIREELEELVEYLRVFPLRAKKAEQFETWCDAHGF